MQRRTKLVLAGAAVAGVIAAGSGAALALGGDRDTPITGEDLEEASAAALAHTGEGTVTEVVDEDSFYEVEVTLDDGRQIDDPRAMALPQGCVDTLPAALAGGTPP
jgi:hypothetical protein